MLLWLHLCNHDSVLSYLCYQWGLDDFNSYMSDLCHAFWTMYNIWKLQRFWFIRHNNFALPLCFTQGIIFAILRYISFSSLGVLVSFFLPFSHLFWTKYHFIVAISFLLFHDIICLYNTNASVFFSLCKTTVICKPFMLILFNSEPRFIIFVPILTFIIRKHNF